jgi:hypothetical protein
MPGAGVQTTCANNESDVSPKYLRITIYDEDVVTNLYAAANSEVQALNESRDAFKSNEKE